MASEGRQGEVVPVDGGHGAPHRARGDTGLPATQRCRGRTNAIFDKQPPAATIVADVIFGAPETPQSDPVHESVHGETESPLIDDEDSG